jgi:hypothetical protein
MTPGDDGCETSAASADPATITLLQPFRAQTGEPSVRAYSQREYHPVTDSPSPTPFELGYAPPRLAEPCCVCGTIPYCRSSACKSAQHLTLGVKREGFGLSE